VLRGKTAAAAGGTGRTAWRRTLASGLLAATGVLLAVRPPAFGHLPLDEYQEAIAEEIAHHPGDAALILRQAQAYRIAHEWDAALAAIERAAAGGAHPDEVRAERALLYFDAGRLAEAIREFDALLAAGAERPMIRFARGAAWMASGRPERAADDFSRAVEHLKRPTPDHVLAWRDALLAAGRRAEALAALDRGMRRVGVVASLQLPAVDLALALGRDDDAVARLDALLARHPGNEAWLFRKGEILRRAGREQEARQAFAAALRAIEARPAHRRGVRVRDLERRLRASLAAPSTNESSNGGT
jgi:tetratricopeptide (TPR) repeat protein